MTFEEMRDIIVETLSCDAEDVTMEAKLSEDLGADSLAAVELSMALEEEFGVSEMSEEDIAGIATVGDLVTYLQNKLDA